MPRATTRPIFFAAAHSKKIVRIPLANGLIAGRLDGDRNRAGEKLSSDSQAGLFLVTSDRSIRVLDLTGGQFSIERRKDEYWATDCARDSRVCRLNDDAFTSWKLLLNDRISILDKFEFRFDGDCLVLVPKKTDEMMIEVQDLKKSHDGSPGLAAVDNITVTIKAGEFVGVIGPSGCGKTTFLNLLSGALQPTKGTVLIDGANPCSPDEATRGRIGVVPQKDIVHRELTVWQAVSMSAALRLPSSASATLRTSLVERVLFDLGLEDHFHQRVKMLSGGQKKRVSIAVEILKETNLLILDEPSSGLDPSSEEKLIDKLRELSRQGRTVICTTHMLELAHLFDKILFMARGRKLHFETPHAIAASLGTRAPDPEEVPFLRAIFHSLEEEGAAAQEEDKSGIGYRTYANGMEVHISLLDQTMRRRAEDALRMGMSLLFNLSGSERDAAQDYKIVYELWRFSRNRKNGSRVSVVYADPKFEEVVQANRRTGMIHVYKNREKALEKLRFGPLQPFPDEITRPPVWLKLAAWITLTAAVVVWYLLLR